MQLVSVGRTNVLLQGPAVEEIICRPEESQVSNQECKCQGGQTKDSQTQVENPDAALVTEVHQEAWIQNLVFLQSHLGQVVPLNVDDMQAHLTLPTGHVIQNYVCDHVWLHATLLVSPDYSIRP